jgi:Cytochrome c554 and c-prime
MLRHSRKGHPLWIAGMLAVGLLMGGCSDGSDGADGLDGQDGADGASTAQVSGTVVNAITNAPIAGVTVETTPAVPGVVLVTDANGRFSGELPIGPYTLACQAANYNQCTEEISVVAGVPVTADMAMEPTKPVMISVTAPPAGVGPGDTFALTVTPTIMDGSTVSSILWKQSASAQATIEDPTSATTNITLGSEAAYKDELFKHVERLDRWMVVGVSPLALEEAAHAAFTVTVTTTNGTYSAVVEVNAELDFATVSPGLRAVPKGVVVLLNGKEQASYDWTLVVPSGTATLHDATTRNPWFVPDVSGKYTLSVTDTTGAPVVVTLDIYSGTWIGGISGQDADGRPNMFCAYCHNEQVDLWKQSGHAEILKDNLNTGGHYSDACFSCHAVGYNKDADNEGFDDANDYVAFYNNMFGGHYSTPDPGNWDYMLATFPYSAQKANVQCENCHGPNDTLAHQNDEISKERVNLSSDVCGTCHGEPPRHGRFQQWEDSAHANYELAIDEGMSGSCAKCHTANGFIAWQPILASGNDGPAGSSPKVTWSQEDVHPQTCTTCHDPHAVGTTTGEGTNAPMRIQGDTYELMSGFTAYSVGKGAICMQCHNSRRGLRNEENWPTTSASDPDRAPHLGTQADVVMGQNAYFVEIGFRGPHGFIDDTCVKCHMSLTDPPEEFSYQKGGTNHTFEASGEICSECHGAFTVDNVQDITERTAEVLHETIVESLYLEIARQIGLGNVVLVSGYATADEQGSRSLIIDSMDDVSAIEFSESHGRQSMEITVIGLPVYHVQMHGGTDIRPSDDPNTATGNSLYETDGGKVIARAGWNYLLFHADGSHGVHNPRFAGLALEGAITALQEEYAD